MCVGIAYRPCGHSTPGALDQPLETLALQADDRSDVALVELLDGCRDERGTLPQVERTKGREARCVDAEAFKNDARTILDADRRSVARLSEDALTEPCRCSLWVAELDDAYGAGREGVRSQSRCARLISKGQE